MDDRKELFGSNVAPRKRVRTKKSSPWGSCPEYKGAAHPHYLVNCPLCKAERPK